MERQVDDKSILDRFCEEFCDVVERHVRYIVCSGYVAIAHGRSRGTEDIDMILDKLDLKEFESLHSDLINAGFVCMQSDDPLVIFERYLDHGESVRYVWKGEGHLPPEMEIKFAKDELDLEQLDSRQKFPLTKLDVYFSSIEGNIAFKEELLRSQKDLEDAEHLRLIYKNDFSEEKINLIKEKIKRLR